MSAVTQHNLETPSKKVAAGLAGIDVNATPSKKSAGKINLAEADDDFSEPAFLTKGKKVDGAVKSDAEADDVHGKFVGEVDLPEEEEPLLVESSRRFVLFPIRFHEVRSRSMQLLPCLIHQHSLTLFPSLRFFLPLLFIDLANVQEGRSLLLDRRRDRPFQGSSRLGQQAQRQRASLHLSRPCLLRRFRRYR